MKVQYDGETVTVGFNENGNMFTLESTRKHREGEIEAYCSARRAPDMGPNKVWILNEFLDIFTGAEIVEVTSEGWNTDESEVGYATLCDIVHPEFNDDGFSPFGDFCRSRLGQQCQYGSRYIDGRLEGYPNLGEGLRFNNGKGYRGETRELDTSDYHSVRIHRDDMDEFERRYKEYHEERLR